MGAGALAPCSWISPAGSPSLSEERTDLYPIFKIDVALPVSPSASLPSDNAAITCNVTRTDHVTLSARAAGHFGQPLHHLPLGSLKRLLLEYRQRASELALHQSLDSDVALVRRLLLENYLKGVFMIDILQDSVPLLVFLGVLSTSYVDHVALRSYRRQILHLQVLEFYTRPGDLILFNGRAKASVFQRSMTRSEWDHVALVVPAGEGGGLQLLEATGDGVTLTPLTTRLLAYSTSHVRYLALRKLRTPLLSRAVVNDLLERFTAEVEGLSYGLSIRQILHAAGPGGHTRSRSFFCSELVAEAYKALGILSRSREATDFWPGSFSPGHLIDAELSRHGASLSPEILLDCNLLEVAFSTNRTS
ncbi:WD repeat-containing protein 19 [Phytophthora pseudosyringae]|uniref:WD repeat-containing protein 19 n=1 Tax=Phytophthora pseudosyringae TaxID=221518 RepID=A0A8T1W352_9STRA|nr:WD repeat-containing protein 19 [Phytophthora pseudosyringae]